MSDGNRDENRLEEAEMPAINLPDENDETKGAPPVDPKATEELVEKFTALELFSHLHRHKSDLIKIIQESANIDLQEDNLFSRCKVTYDQMYKVLGDYIEQRGHEENIVLAFGHELDNFGSNLITSIDVLTRIAKKVRDGENKLTYKTAIDSSTEKCAMFIKRLNYFIGHLDARLTPKDIPIHLLVDDSLSKVEPLLNTPIQIEKGNLDQFMHFRVANSVYFQLAITEIIRNAVKADTSVMRINATSDSNQEIGVTLLMTIYTNGMQITGDTAYLNPEEYSSNRGVKLLKSLGFNYTIRNNDEGEGCIATLQIPVKFGNGNKQPVEA